MMGRNKPLSGSVGVEIEIEGENLPAIFDGVWRTDRDGSLKTAESYEYVLEKPVYYTKVNRTIDELASRLQDSKIFESERAGVHVHINMQHDTISSMGTFICLYYLFETALLRFCGTKRSGNLFCLRLRDADAPIDSILRFLTDHRLSGFRTDTLRYASLNFKALYQYGSLEFRGMRSTGDFKQIKTWVHLLLKLRTAARKIGTPQSLGAMVEREGINSVLYRVFGEEKASLLYHQDFEKEAMEDYFRILQLIYTGKWEKGVNPPVANKYSFIKLST